MGSPRILLDSEAAATIASDLELPGLLVGVELVSRGDAVPDGYSIVAVAPIWQRFIAELRRDPKAFAMLDWRQCEELVAGGWQAAGWTVTLTPRSNDGGRDVIAERSDIGSVRLIDQVKFYKPGLVVPANDVRAIYGVLNMDRKASKALITTTSDFAPGVVDEFAAYTPSRVELRNGNQLRDWLATIATK